MSDRKRHMQKQELMGGSVDAGRSADVSVRQAVHPPVLVIACGALAGDIIALQRQLGMAQDAMTLQCLPAKFHNTPQNIAPAVETILKQRAHEFDHILVAYGECGTGGALDRVLDKYEAVRLPGAHCYEFFATPERFQAIVDDEIGSFFVTDYLVRHFDRLVIAGLGLDRFPHLRTEYFGNYRQLVYLSQRADETLLAQAARAAEAIGLTFRHEPVGYGVLGDAIANLPVAVEAAGV